MPTLAEVQERMSAALVRGDHALISGLAAPSAVGAARAFDVHRRTILGALTTALRLSFSTVHWLTGERFFSQAVADHAAHAPPRDALLSGFIKAFPDFIGGYPLAASLPYIGDAARFDLAIDEAQHAARGWGAPIALDSAVSLRLSLSLRVVQASAPVDQIRDVFQNGDVDALTGIDMRARSRSFAVYRAEEGVRARTLSQTSGLFLHYLLTGCEPEASLEAALGQTSRETALDLIQGEILNTGFVRLELHQNKEAADA